MPCKCVNRFGRPRDILVVSKPCLIIDPTFCSSGSDYQIRFIYNIAVRSGKFELFRRWMISNTPADKRILLLIIGYSFGALLEGMSSVACKGC
jgi:hypothetical protein